jgi:hypothetical protein
MAARGGLADHPFDACRRMPTNRMETAAMNLFAAFRRAASPRRRPAQPDWVDAPAPAAHADADDDATAAAGSWFDSSWLLRAGAQVTEHDSVDPVANDLPLGWWLDGPAARPRARR